MDSELKSSETTRAPDLAELWQSAFKRMEEWMKPDIGGLGHFQGASQRWMTHRLEDFQKAVEASRKIAECRDLGEAAAIQQKWLAECTQRLVADWTSLVTPTPEAPRSTPKKAAG